MRRQRPGRLHILFVMARSCFALQQSGDVTVGPTNVAHRDRQKAAGPMPVRRMHDVKIVTDEAMCRDHGIALGKGVLEWISIVQGPIFNHLRHNKRLFIDPHPTLSTLGGEARKCGRELLGGVTQ